jgi:hypothetical protein
LSEIAPDFWFVRKAQKPTHVRMSAGGFNAPNSQKDGPKDMQDGQFNLVAARRTRNNS